MKILTFALGALAIAAAQPALAGTELVTNGSFSATTFTANSEFSTVQGGTGVTGWTPSAGYNLYYFAGTQSTVSAANRYGDPQTYLYSNATLSPGGGNFVALDGDTNINGKISQTLSGLTTGASYTVSFDWAASQLVNRSGATTERIVVGFGNQSVTTPTVSNPSRGFTGWFHQSYTFTASATSQVLSFLSIGTPNGLPPIALLDDVSVQATPVPEPAMVATLGLGTLALAGFAARRRR